MSEQIKVDTNKSLESWRKLPAKKRIDALLAYEDPEELVKAMTAHDLLLTIDELGGESALELLELMQPIQVQEVLDLAIWDNDRLEANKAGNLLSLFFEANADRAVQQLDGLDVELIGLMLKMVADIYDTSLNEEPPDFSGLASTSPGGRFIICFDDSAKAQGLSHAMHRYIESLYGVDMKRVLSLLEKVRYELASGLEEASFKWRDGRLLDMGILPRDERLAYFATLNVGQLNKGETKTAPFVPESEGTTSSPLMPYVNRLGEKYPFLQAAIAGSSEIEAKGYLDSLVHASLNMHASLSGNFGDSHAMLHTVEYVKTLAEFGLAQASGGRLQQGTTLLRANGVRNMIRLGRTALVNLRKLLRTALNDPSFLMGEDFNRADSPLREMARVLMLAEPRFYEGLLNAKKLTVRFFASLLELNATLRAVHELRFRAKLVGPEVLGCTLGMLKDHPTLAHANIYARYVLNAFLCKNDPLDDISGRELKRVIVNGTLNDDFVAFAKKYANDLGHKLSEITGQNLDQALEMTNNFSSAVLIQLEQNPILLLS